MKNKNLKQRTIDSERRAVAAENQMMNLRRQVAQLNLKNAELTKYIVAVLKANGNEAAINVNELSDVQSNKILCRIENEIMTIKCE